MEKVIFGKTDLTVSRTGFGCIPIQRVSYDESTALLRRAYENGITLFDTANAYTTSEERIGIALQDVRDKIVLCTKTSPLQPDDVMANIDSSLRMMQTDYIDVLQIHNPSFVPRPGGGDGVYDCFLKAKEQGKIRHIGITSHSRDIAREAVLSGLYETLQYPLSYLSADEELELIKLCGERNIGLLAMKALCGGLLTNAKAAFAFLRQYENVIPIWGIQKMPELDEFLAYEKEPPILDKAMLDTIQNDKETLAGNFCRCCGYCLPCPANIPIPNAARITLLLRRMPADKWSTPEWQDNMKRIDNCTGCGHCKAHCPYGLDTPELLKRQQAEFFEMLNRPVR
ncbi:MAG: aldo/keto reductase [Defluviitaleaceae bacterium]|nr:aldo/keto reductase [Defluviitaleaceae bacterium]MCL2836208.1 aldo/keto reductase [Defluviitaleaceae bacterium]